MSNLYAGIDAGTTVVKTVVFDEQGNELFVAKRATEPHFSEDGLVTQNMEKHWEAVCFTLKEAVENSRSFGEIKALGVTGQGAGFWMIGKDGKPIESIVWIDGRAANYIRKWEKEGVIGRSGRICFNGNFLSVGAWMLDHGQDILEKVKYACFCKDVIKYRLTGEMTTDITDLSDSSVAEVLNPIYSKEHLGAFGAEGLLEFMPPIAPSGEIIGTVTKKAAQDTGLLEGTPVINGAIDIVATAVGNGVVEKNIACSIIGTTMFNEISVDTNDVNYTPGKDAYSVSCHLIPERKLYSLGTMAGAPNLDWFAGEFMRDENGRIDFGLMEKMIRTIPVGSGGVIYHPYIGQGGERAPFINPLASAQFSGLKNTHTKAHMLRAVYEGVALSCKDCYEHFPMTPDKIRIAGGGSSSPTWVQMIADCTGIDVEVTRGDEKGARGVAIMAAVASGEYKDIYEGCERMVNVTKVMHTNPDNKIIYDDVYVLYKKTYENMKEVWDGLETIRQKSIKEEK